MHGCCQTLSPPGSATGFTPPVGIWLPVLMARPGVAQLRAQTSNLSCVCGQAWTVADPCSCHQAGLAVHIRVPWSCQYLPCLSRHHPYPLLACLTEQPRFSLLTRTAHSPQGVGEKQLLSSRERRFLALLPGIALS